MALKSVSLGAIVKVAVPFHPYKVLESIELVRNERNEQRLMVAFNSRPFVLCGLPSRRPPAGSLQHTRRNGRFKLEMHPEYDPPFGQDRLIPVWVSTLAVRQKSRTILFRSAAEIPDEFDLPKDASALSATGGRLPADPYGHGLLRH